MFNVPKIITAFFAALLLAACGGDDGGSPPAPPNNPPALAAPTGLAATSGDAQAALSWSPVTGAETYKLKRATVSGGPYTVIQSNLTTTNHIDTGLANGTTYYYVVTAAITTQESANSAQTTALPVAAAPVGSASQVSQYGVTWTFDRAYPVGQFANGDWWVVGPIQVTSITPDAAGGRNGWAVNPTNYLEQGFDSRAFEYRASLVPTLPLNAAVNTSIVKTISLNPGASGCQPCVKTAAVLTVVGAVPPGGGAAVFRPPYVGASKPLYEIGDLRVDLLPSLAPPAGSSTPTLATIENRFKKLQLDNLEGWVARYIHPQDSMPDYGADISRDNGDAALRLMLNDTPDAKRPALIAYVQYGIDLYHMRLTGQGWGADGGHNSGRKLPMAFAAVMLDNPEMKATVSNSPYDTFGEDGQLYFSQQADGGRGKVLWGRRCSESAYWQELQGGGGSRDCRDPYGYVDGAGTEMGLIDSYQGCCTTQAWKGAALSLHLMPQLATVWNSNNLLSYMERWVSVGVWALPDPCALQRPGTLTGTCVAGTGRFANKHGGLRDQGYYDSNFAAAMWGRHHQ